MTLRLMAVFASVLLGACEGQLNIDISGTPPESVNAAVLRVSGLTLTNTEGGTVNISLNDQNIDFVNLNRGRISSLLSSEGITTGNYSKMRVLITAQSQVLDSYIENTDGGEDSIVLQAGSQAIATSAFSIREDKDTNLTLHFDFRSSLLPGRNAAEDRLLVPRVRLIETSVASSISGDIADDILTGSACDSTAADAPSPVIYVYAGLNITPDDLDNRSPEPISTALVTITDSQADYVASFLPAGDYTLAITCDAKLDDPSVDEVINFLATRTITLAASTNATLNFTN